MIVEYFLKLQLFFLLALLAGFVVKMELPNAGIFELSFRSFGTAFVIMMNFQIIPWVSERW